MARSSSVHEKGFTVLYEAPNPTIDIVYVHGFTGHPKHTWTLKRAMKRSKKRAATPSTPQSDTITSEGQQREGVYWPADLACRTIPDSRILTYGYDTRLRHWFQGPVSQKTVYDHAWDLLYSLEALRRNPNERSRPIVFVAHSLGGIIVKEAMRRSQGCASTKAHLHSIFEAVVGLLFFGTPHRGADPRNFFHHLLSASARAFGVQVNSQIVNTLMPDAERLAELRDEFPIMCRARKWQVFSFQEEYGDLMLFGSKVVDDQSSCLDDPTIEMKQHISRNHMDMCRFSGLQDPEYSKVAAALTFILGTIDNAADTVDPTEIRPEGYYVAGSTSQQPPSASPSTSTVLHQQPPPDAGAVAFDPQITDPLGIEVSMLPSRDFLLFMDRLPSEAHAHMADVIFSNYSQYELKLFQIFTGGKRFPDTANDLSLEQWTNKLVHAHERLNESDSIHGSHLHDYTYSNRVFKHITTITSLVDPWGKVKIDVAERCLIYGLALCQVLKGWDCLDRLKALWAAIHRPESPSIKKALLMPPSSTQPPGRYEPPAVEKEEDERPSKKARVEEDLDQSDRTSEITSETSGTSEASERGEESWTTPHPEQDDAWS